MKRTEKSKANSWQKSKSNSRQKSDSQQQARQEQSQRQAEAKQSTATETRRSTRRSSTLQKKAAASDADVQQGQGEVITTIPKIDFDEEIVRVQENHPDSSEAAIQNVQKIVKIPQMRDREHSDGFFQLKSRGPMKPAQQLQTAATSRRSLPQQRRISNRTLRTFR